MVLFGCVVRSGLARVVFEFRGGCKLSVEAPNEHKRSLFSGWICVFVILLW